MKNLTKTEKEEFKTLEKLQKGISYNGSLFGPIPKTNFGKMREKAVEKANAKILLIFLYLLLSIMILWLAYLLGKGASC